ncbi:MAG TPA: M23 family metallopeptidase [Patescibacteria group bacterium]|nr:M23 family metallopeptidase [Patescibacteria group bacterium]
MANTYVDDIDSDEFQQGDHYPAFPQSPKNLSPDEDEKKKGIKDYAQQGRDLINKGQNVRDFFSAAHAPAGAGNAAAAGASTGSEVTAGATGATSGVGATGAGGALAGETAAVGTEAAASAAAPVVAGAIETGVGGVVASAGGSAAATAPVTITVTGASTPLWPIAAAFIFLFIVFVVVILHGSSVAGLLSSSNNSTSAPTAGSAAGNTAACVAAGGSLDYSVSIHDTNALPQNPDSVKADVLKRWPDAKINNWDTIVNQSVANGWNPSLILSIWIEESGAQAGVGYADGNPDGYTDALGCDPTHNQTTDINKSLACVFNSFKDYNGFEDLMCVYGGDGFHRAPCTFKDPPPKGNPDFPINIKKWYSEISPDTINSNPQVCGPTTSGDWPTTGPITQGPEGSTDHAGLLAKYQWEAIDIGGGTNTNIPVYSSHDGTVSAVHDCIRDGDCTAGYEGFGNSVEVTTNTDSGSFTTLYGHLAEIDTTNGATVKVGDRIGIMGQTGHAPGGIHLHFQFTGARMEPPYIPKAVTPRNCDTPTVPCDPVNIAPSKPGV